MARTLFLAKLPESLHDGQCIRGLPRSPDLEPPRRAIHTVRYRRRLVAGASSRYSMLAEMKGFTMATVAVCDELDAPIERVWGCFADFGDLSARAPGRRRSRSRR